MTSIRSWSVIVIAALANGLSVSALAQSGTAQKCPPVTAKNQQEALMMEQSAGRDGCWVRDKNTGLLMFVSHKAPSANYPPLLKASPPAAAKAAPLTRLSAHGPNSPASFAKVVGTWAGTWCGLTTTTLTLRAVAGVLSGTMTSKEMVMNERVTSCDALGPRFTGAPPETDPLSNLGFDGQILWGSVTVSGAGAVPFTISMVGDKLVQPSDEPGFDPTVFRRIAGGRGR